MDFDELDDLDPVEVVDLSTDVRELDIVVYGASGYIGGLIVEHLDAMLAVPGTKPCKWGLAGRNMERIRQVGLKCKTSPDIIESATPVQISELAGRCRVLISAVGPYSVCGEDIVRECVSRVTHYIDLTSEVVWIHDIIKKYHTKAKERGVMLVHCVGGLCSPSEMMCHALVMKLGPLKQYHEYFRQVGGISGGLVEAQIKTMGTLTPEKLAVMCDPLCLGGAQRTHVLEAHLDDSKVAKDALFPSIWLTQTVDSVFRSQIIRRTCSLFKDAQLDAVSYGDDVRVAVHEWSSNKRDALQRQQHAGTVSTMEFAAGVVEHLQAERQRGVAPLVGQGPQRADRANSSVTVFAAAEGENGEWAHAMLSSGDALDVTAAAAVAGALVLVEELDTLEPRERGGVLTPAFAFHGSTWFERLTTGAIIGASCSKIALEVRKGMLAEGEFGKLCTSRPGYEMVDPLPSGWPLPALDRPSADGATAWPPWEPMDSERWRKYPRFGRGQAPENISDLKKVVNDMATGDFWGIEFPFTPMQLKEMGPKWLTKAFHTSGVLSKDNAILSITDFNVKAWDVTGNDPNDADFGGAGCKVLLRVQYKSDPGELSEHLFVKMPHEFNGKNERFTNAMKYMDWPECMFYNLIGGRLPLRTPRTYFSDMCRRTTNFCLILESIPYGDRWDREYKPGMLLPNTSKYRDWLIPMDSLVEMYFAHARCQAQLFGWYRKVSSITDQIDLCFRDEKEYVARTELFKEVGPLSKEGRAKWFLRSLSHPELKQFALAADQPPNIAKGFVQLADGFVCKTARHTMPRQWTSQAYLDKWVKESMEMAPYLSEMAWYSQMMPEYFTFAHPNLMIDNAFFWTDDAGVMRSGLIDWGACTMMAIPRAVAGCWIAAEVKFMDEHEAGLINCFLDEFEKITGEKLDHDEFKLHLKLAYVCIHVGSCASVRWCLQLIPKKQWPDVVDRFDPKIDDKFMMRCYHVQTELFLGMWENRNPYPYFLKWMDATGMPQKA